MENKVWVINELIINCAIMVRKYGIKLMNIGLNDCLLQNMGLVRIWVMCGQKPCKQVK